jgi:uncharacterized membrane protein YgdD (TMEM256/DUF423 family)
VNWAAIGAAFLAFAVALGAFGAHALRSRFDVYATGIWEKAVFYHFVHALGLLAVALAARAGAVGATGANRVCWLLITGILVFSGSLYALALSGIRSLGAITPIGGTAFIAAWVLLAIELVRAR